MHYNRDLSQLCGTSWIADRHGNGTDVRLVAFHECSESDAYDNSPVLISSQPTNF